MLLDANVLVALVVADHVHHDAADTWLGGQSQYATCPITEAALLRLLVREGQPAGAGIRVLEALSTDPRHEFWPDDIPYQDVPVHGVIGHRQVTDAYLAQLSRNHGGRLASFDAGLAQLHNDVVDLIPV